MRATWQELILKLAEGQGPAQVMKQGYDRKRNTAGYRGNYSMVCRNRDICESELHITKMKALFPVQYFEFIVPETGHAMPHLTSRSWNIPHGLGPVHSSLALPTGKKNVWAKICRNGLKAHPEGKSTRCIGSFLGFKSRRRWSTGNDLAARFISILSVSWPVNVRTTESLHVAHLAVLILQCSSRGNPSSTGSGESRAPAVPRCVMHTRPLQALHAIGLIILIKTHWHQCWIYGPTWSTHKLLPPPSSPSTPPHFSSTLLSQQDSLLHHSTRTMRQSIPEIRVDIYRQSVGPAKTQPPRSWWLTPPSLSGEIRVFRATLPLLPRGH
ncbi:hypothetical protein RRG08_053947 [Elysia crispata]|uniref:Uncharacterized protein n=1 Tax=Elysia crispata TaxID=231223 RepID=A0AAE1DFR2_9GAST|nr:hypothetical protein RRG08_053947 [Elysia crispata]